MSYLDGLEGHGRITSFSLTASSSDDSVDDDESELRLDSLETLDSDDTLDSESGAGVGGAGVGAS